MKSKKKKKENNKNIKKYTATSNHQFSKNISRIIDELGKTSKNTFNHYLFTNKFFLLYKDKIYEEVFLDTIKTNKLENNIINNLIETKFKKYFETYQNEH